MPSPRRARGLRRLDDADAAVYTIGQAAELLGVPVAGLRRLDDAAALEPHRSSGGQRRYSRRQLEQAERLLALVEEGNPIAAAGRIADLEREVVDLSAQVDELRAEIADLRSGAGTAGATGPPGTDPGTAPSR